MFRALAGYIFGSTEDVSSKPVECDAKEVNDWLLVNMVDPSRDANGLEVSIIDYDMEVGDEDSPSPVCSWVGPKDLLFEESRCDELSSLPDPQTSCPDVIEEMQSENQNCFLSGEKTQEESVTFLHAKVIYTKASKRTPTKTKKPAMVSDAQVPFQTRPSNIPLFKETAMLPKAQVKRTNVSKKRPPSKYEKLTSLCNQITKPDESLPTLPVPVTRTSPLAKNETNFNKEAPRPFCSKENCPNRMSYAQVLKMGKTQNEKCIENEKKKNEKCKEQLLAVATTEYKGKFQVLTDMSIDAVEEDNPIYESQTLAQKISQGLSKKATQKLMKDIHQKKRKVYQSSRRVRKGKCIDDKKRLLIDVTNELKGRFPVPTDTMPIDAKGKDIPIPKSGTPVQKTSQRLSEMVTQKLIEAIQQKQKIPYVRPSVQSFESDLMQRIKELEPEQQAIQRALKKSVNRGQLNRHNKAYLYETSTKKNWRKNLQQNPSVANFNRKC